MKFSSNLKRSPPRLTVRRIWDLKWVLNKQCGMVWDGLLRFRVGIRGRFLWTRWWWYDKSGSMKGGEYLGQMGYYKLHEKDSVPLPIWMAQLMVKFYSHRQNRIKWLCDRTRNINLATVLRMRSERTSWREDACWNTKDIVSWSKPPAIKRRWITTNTAKYQNKTPLEIRISRNESRRHTGHIKNRNEATAYFKILKEIIWN
jgi:hypothetical protein